MAFKLPDEPPVSRLKQKQTKSNIETHKTWSRENGRMKRHPNNDDIKISPLEELYSCLQNQNTNNFMKKSVVFKKRIQNSYLCDLPGEILYMVIQHLSCTDVKMLTRTCKALKEFVNRNYVEYIMFPLSPQNLRELAGRSVLSIVSLFDISIMKEGKFLNMIKKINLTYLKELKFNGLKYYHHGRILDPSKYSTYRTYISALIHFLTHAPNLQILSINVEGSKEMLNIINIISNQLRHLTQLSLEAVIIEDGEQRTYTPVNMVLSKVLCNPAIKKLTMTAEWGKLSGMCHELEVRSKYLEFFDFQAFYFNTRFEIKVMECDKLKELYFNKWHSRDPFFACLYHGKEYRCNNIAYLLANGCPRLERFNDDDNIKTLRELSNAYGYGNNWERMLWKNCTCKRFAYPMIASSSSDTDNDTDETDNE